MRMIATMLLVLIVAGIAPVAVASGFCAGASGCTQADVDTMVAAGCCGEIVCSDRDTADLFSPEPPLSDAAEPAAEEFAYAAPAAPVLAESAPVLPVTAAERLSVLSILLI